MFNTYTKAYNNLKINAVSGTLIKSHPKSKFINFHSSSTRAEYVFDDEKPRLGVYGKEIVVLQIMLTGGEKRDLLVEYVYLEDFLRESDTE